MCATGTYALRVSRTSSIFSSAAACLGALSLVLVTSPAQADNPPLRVLLTGDSITQGFHGDYTWRYRFARELTRQGVAYDLVGSRKDPIVKAGFASAQYLDPNFDSDHFALGGSLLGSQAQRIDNEINAQRPDVVVLSSGINNLRAGSTPAQTDANLRAWVASARSVKADIRIVLSPVLDAIDYSRPYLRQSIVDYNALLAATAAELATDESPITVADTSRGWSATVHTAENLHPNPTGETLIAQRIAETFHQLGYLPQQPDIFRRTVWNRTPRVGVAFDGQRAVLRWDHQALTSGHVYLHRVGYPGYTSSSNFGGGTMTTTKLVPGAVYDFGVQFVRGRMVSPFGPLTRARVPLPPRPAAVAGARIDAAGVHWASSVAATSYRVQFQRVHRKRWITRTTTGLELRVAKVRRARVYAVNAGGPSPVRNAAR